MVRHAPLTAFAFAISLALVTPAHAQNPNSQKPKKNANQVPETGQNDPVTDNPLERVVSSVPVSVRADGTIVAELDDSFMEASTVTIGADGVLKYEHFTGVKHAEAALRGIAADGLLITRARPLPYVPYPGHEDKE